MCARFAAKAAVKVTAAGRKGGLSHSPTISHSLSLPASRPLSRPLSRSQPRLNSRGKPIGGMLGFCEPSHLSRGSAAGASSSPASCSAAE